MLGRLKAFRVSILLQLLLLPLGWMYREQVLLWWVKALPRDPNVIICFPRPLSLLSVADIVMVTTWVIVAPFVASEAWRASMQWAGRPQASRLHWAFGLATGGVVVTSMLVARESVTAWWSMLVSI